MSESARRAITLGAAADTQDGVISRQQLAAAGVPGWVVRSHVQARRWRAIGRRVIVTHTGPLTERQLWWVAVLDGGPGCVLSGLTALRASGLEGFAGGVITTAVPQSGRAAQRATHVRRRSRRVTQDAIHPARRPPMLRREPAVLDALEHIEHPRRGCALLAAVVQQRLVPASRLRLVVATATGLPHRRLYLGVVGDIEGGSHSLLELDFLGLSKAAGIDPPRRQVVRTDQGRRRRYLDADFGGFTVEIDGAVHLRPRTWWEDMYRQNQLVITGRPILRFASVGIRLGDERIVEQLRHAALRWPAT